MGRVGGRFCSSQIVNWYSCQNEQKILPCYTLEALASQIVSYTLCVETNEMQSSIVVFYIPFSASRDSEFQTTTICIVVFIIPHF